MYIYTLHNSGKDMNIKTYAIMSRKNYERVIST